MSVWPANERARKEAEQRARVADLQRLEACQVCWSPRPLAQLTVTWRKRHFPRGRFRLESVRHCNDRAECAAAAVREIEWIP